MKVGALEFTHVLRADVPQDLLLLGLAHDVDQRDAVSDADPVQHLAEVGGGRGVHERLVPLQPHGLDHAQGGQRIHEAGGALGGVVPSGMGRHCATLRRGTAQYIAPPIMPTVLPISAWAASELPGGHHDARALVAHRQRLADAPGNLLHRGGGNIRGQHGAIRGAPRPEGRAVGRTHEQEEIRGIDGRRVDAHQHLVRARFGEFHVGEGDLQGVVVPDE